MFDDLYEDKLLNRVVIFKNTLQYAFVENFFIYFKEQPVYKTKR